MKTNWLVFGSVFVCLFINVSAFGAQTTQGVPERGEELYDRYCSECHGARGDGTGAVGHVIHERPADFHSPDSRSRTDQELFEIILYGRTIEMHGWEGLLTEEQVWDVVRYVRQLAPFFPQQK